MKRNSLRRTNKPLKSTSPLKSGKSSLKKGKPLRKRSSVPSNYKVYAFGFKDQVEVMEFVWEINKDSKGIVRSEISGKRLNGYLGKEQWYSCFMHVLDKKNYPLYKLNPDNYMLGTPIEHTLADQGTKADIDRYEKDNDCSFDIFFNKQEELKPDYEKYK